MNDQDAKSYGQALANALRHLPITTSQKYVDFTVLGLAVITHTTPRIVMDMQIRQARQQRPRPQGPAQVFQFRPTSPPPQQEAAPERFTNAGNPPPPPPPPPAAWSNDMTYEPDLGMGAD